MGFHNEYARTALKREMYRNNCSASDFERVRRIEHSLGEYESNKLLNWMSGVKAAVSLASGATGYFLGNYFASQMSDDNIVPKIAGGLSALVLAKLVAKPAARAGLDLGLRF